jgi:hypothetical protein
LRGFNSPVTSCSLLASVAAPVKVEWIFASFLSVEMLKPSPSCSIKKTGPSATVILVAKKSLLKGKDLDNRLLEQKLMIVRLLKEKGFSEKKIRAIMIFLHNYVQFGKPEMNRIFVERVDNIFGKKNFMGIAEHLAELRATEALKVGIEKGREEGREEGKENASRTFVENLLKDGLYTQEKIASLADVSLAFVKKVKKEQRSK